MAKRSKRYREAAKLIEAGKLYAIPEAVTLVKQTGGQKFDAGVELHLKLGIDPKQGDQIVRGSVTLPHSTGKKVRIVAFAEGQAAKDAEAAGADRIGGPELVKEVKAKGGIDADVCVAHPTMMKHLGPVAKILGPKGLMPNPKNETVGDDLGRIVRELKAGRLTFRADDSGNVHALVGRVSTDEKSIEENIQALLEAVRRVKPASSKGTYLQNVTLAATMGPPIRVAP